MAVLEIIPAQNNKTHAPIEGDTLLVYLIDKSGSMYSCWDDTIGGMEADLKTQMEQDDGKTDALVYFFSGNIIWGSEPTADRSPLTKAYDGNLSESHTFDSSKYAPGGSTPLYDSVGRVIKEVADRIEATDHMVNVIFTIMTDGGNTDHQGFSADQVKQMIETYQNDGWTFTYFGANQDAWAVGSTFGISKGNVVNYDVENIRQTMATASAARSSFINTAKSAVHKGESYTTASFFADAGQSQDDYK